jgi:hypothetical protein
MSSLQYLIGGGLSTTLILIFVNYCKANREGKFSEADMRALWIENRSHTYDYPKIVLKLMSSKLPYVTAPEHFLDMPKLREDAPMIPNDIRVQAVAKFHDIMSDPIKSKQCYSVDMIAANCGIMRSPKGPHALESAYYNRTQRDTNYTQQCICDVESWHELEHCPVYKSAELFRFISKSMMGSLCRDRVYLKNAQKYFDSVRSPAKKRLYKTLGLIS